MSNDLLSLSAKILISLACLSTLLHPLLYFLCKPHRGEKYSELPFHILAIQYLLFLVETTLVISLVFLIVFSDHLVTVVLGILYIIALGIETILDFYYKRNSDQSERLDYPVSRLWKLLLLAFLQMIPALAYLLIKH